MSNATTATSKAGPREWIGLAVLTLPALLVSMDLSVLFMAVPWLSADLQPSAGQLLWIMDIYGFLMAGLLVTMGTLGDRIGRRRLLMVGAVAFGASSLLAAYSTGPEMLTLARALLGVSGATLAPSTLALLRNMFHHDGERRAAVGVWTAAFSAGFPLGAIIGGLLVERFWWGSVFLINLPVMALLLVLARLLLPEFRDPSPRRFDLPGAALSVAAVLTVIWGFKQLAENGWAAGPVALVAAGLALGYAFVRRQRSAAEPLIDIALFRRSAFSVSIAANTVVVMAIAGTGMLVVQYMQLVVGLRPLTAAMWMLPFVAAQLAGIVVGTTVVRWVRPALVVGTGLALAAAGFGLLGLLDADSGVGTLVGFYAVMGLGIGMTMALAVSLVISTAPPASAGAAAAMSETGSEFGGALGIATLGSIAAAGYQARIAEALPPDLTPEAAEAATGTLGGAAAVAEQLPGEVSGPLLEAAHEAFTHGIAVTAVVGAPLLAVMALVVALVLRPASSS